VLRPPFKITAGTPSGAPSTRCAINENGPHECGPPAVRGRR